MARLVGVDIGGSGIKAAVVDTRRGMLVTERLRVTTPQPATPEAVVAATVELISRLDADGPVGIGVPGAIVRGTVMTAANIDPGWIGAPAQRLFRSALGRPVAVLNDADAAGLAEMRFGAGRRKRGVVLLLTLGTGIGSALFLDGKLVPNTEFGHIEIRGKVAEKRASAGARDRKKLSYERWAPLLQEYLERIDALVWPDLMIIGGGVSKRADRFLPLLDVRPPLVAAALQNEAGIVGAALRASEHAARARPARAAAAAAQP